jgi:hypothetical protein
LRIRLPTGTRVELTEQAALKTLDHQARSRADNPALTMGLVGVHAAPSGQPDPPLERRPGGSGLAVQFKPDTRVKILNPLAEAARRPRYGNAGPANIIRASDIVSRV